MLTFASVTKHFLFITEIMICAAPSFMSSSMDSSLVFVTFAMARIALHWTPLWLANLCRKKQKCVSANIKFPAKHTYEHTFLEIQHNVLTYLMRMHYHTDTFLVGQFSQPA